MASQENEPLFEYIKDAITALRLRHQRSDSNRILKHLQEYAATILQEMPMELTTDLQKVDLHIMLRTKTVTKMLTQTILTISNI